MLGGQYFSMIWNLISTILSPIFAFLVIFIIISIIWCWIFKISFARYFNNVIKPVIVVLYSFAYLVFQILQIPVIIFEFIKTFFIQLGGMFSFVINFFNNISNFLYNSINEDNLF